MSSGGSSGYDDEDIPGLESVSSSEYVDESDDESRGPTTSRTPTTTKSNKCSITAKKWLQQDRTQINKHLNIITIYMYSPFLYGHANQTDKWLGWCNQVGLLESDVNYNTGELSELELSAVDVLETAMTWCRRRMADSSDSDSLAHLLQLSDALRSTETIEGAVKMARKHIWFAALVDSYNGSPEIANGVTSTSLGKPNFVEVGCLYVINETAEHVKKHIKSQYSDILEEFEEQCALEEKNEHYIPLRRKADELYKLGKYETAAIKYSEAIICCPFSHRVYKLRAQCYMELKRPREMLCDSIRVLYLQPELSKSYSSYLQSLVACNMTDKAQLAVKRYQSLFSSQKEKDMLHKAAQPVPARKERGEPTEKDKVMRDKVMDVCKQASQACLKGDDKLALYYYEDAVKIMERDSGWQKCLEEVECIRFLISLYYTYGCTLLKKGSYEDAKLALRQFDVINRRYGDERFPGTLLGAAKAYIILHRHREAMDCVRRGRGCLSVYHPEVDMRWPGLEETMAECLPQNLEVRLQQLRDQCQPMCEPDAICRYSNCLQHTSSTNIRIGSAEYKGHTVVTCSESCAIGYHQACWKKFKVEEEIGTEKDLLLTPCPTPDCEGFIVVITLYNTYGEPKNRIEASPEAIAAKKQPPPPSTTPSTGPAHKSKPSGRKVDKSRHKREKDDRERDNPSSERPDRDSDILDGRSLSQGTPTMEDKSLAEDVVSEKPFEERRDSALSEDLRNPEDMITVINRQAEQEEKEPPKLKKKKAKEKERGLESQQRWNELFIHPQRELVGEASCEDQVHNWQPDPEAPFQPPDHLREAIKDFEDTEVPGIGLTPCPPPPGSATMATSGGTWNKTPEAGGLPPSSDLEFIYSYFAEIFKSRGALHPTDTALSDALTFLPDDKKLLVETAGGLRRFLLRSPNFKTHGDLLCMSEDSHVVAASIVCGSKSNIGSTSTDSKPPSSPSTSSTVTKNTKPSLSTLINEHQGESLSGTMNSGSLRFDEEAGIGKSSQTCVYGESLGSGVTSPNIQTPSGSPDFLSPEASPQVPKKKLVEEEQLAKRLGSSSKRTVQPSGSQGAKAGKERGSHVKGRSSIPSELGSQVVPSLVPEVGTSSGKNATGEASSDNVFVSSGSSSSGSLKAMSLKEEAASKSTFVPAGKEREPMRSKRKKDRKRETAERVREGLRHSGTQTWPALTIDRWVMTDPIPPVESYKDRYDEVVREKKDLQQKLEESGDRMYKMQRDHRREVDKVQQQSRQEAKEEAQAKIQELELKLHEAKDRGQHERKDQTEQIRSLKAEIKSLSDKIEKLKKELGKKDQKMAQNFQEHHAEHERLLKEKKKAEDRARSALETQQVALHRAINAEIEVLSIRREVVVRPKEQQLQEVERVCSSVPAGTDYHREWLSFRDKLRTALECFQNVMDDQFHQVKEGKELANLDRVSIPNVPHPANLVQRMPMMRPPFIPVPMVRGPLHPMHGQPHMPPPQPPPPIDLPPTLLPGVGPVGMLNAAPGGPMQTSRGAASMPKKVPGDLPPYNPLPLSASAVRPPPPHRQVDSPVTPALPAGAKVKTSSFDRIVDKLAPKYPHYSREDFKSVLREVRRNNKNTLSGLSLDSIAQQVQDAIDAREKGQGAVGVGPVGGASIGDKRKGNQPQKRALTIPPVAVAPPPTQSLVEYDDEGSCIICYEDMDDKDSCKLSCGHRFHTDCIRSWFKEQNTCPTCRNYALLPDDYPFLH